MATYKDVAMLNDSMDSLTSTLLKKQMMKQQREERDAAQRTADERTGLDREALGLRREAETNEQTFRKDALKQREGSGHLDAVRRTAEDFTKRVAEGMAGEQEIAVMNKWAEANGFPVGWRKPNTATAPRQSEAVLTANHVQTLRHLAAAARAEGDEKYAAEQEDMANRLANHLGPAAIKEPEPRMAVTTEAEPATVKDANGFERPNPNAGQPREKSRTLSGLASSVKRAMLDKQVGAAGKPQGASPATFEDEDAARAVGKKSGDTVYLRGVGLVRLK